MIDDIRPSGSQPLGPFVVCIVAALMLSGCSPPISGQIRSQVTYTGGFGKIHQNPGQFIGETVILGGKIFQTRATDTYSEITVMHMPLDLAGVPYNLRFTRGPYLLYTERHLDPDKFETGILLTVLARITGTQQRTVSAKSHTYPAMRILEIILWEPDKKSRPNFQIIIGGGMG